VDAGIGRHRLRAPTILDAGGAGQAARAGPYQCLHGAGQAFSPEMTRHLGLQGFAGIDARRFRARRCRIQAGEHRQQQWKRQAQ
jgi:hypothetical protein